MLESIIDPQLNRGSATNQIPVWNDTTRLFVPTLALAGLTSIGVTGTATLGQVIDNGLTASRPVFSNGSKQLVSGNLVSWIAGSTTINVVDDGDGSITLSTIDGGIDHGSLAGLGDDDHSQYLLANGTRALAGAWSMGNQVVTNANIDTGDIAVAVVNTEWDAAYTHISQDGSSHTYIDQSVIIAASPTFDNLILDGNLTLTGGGYIGTTTTPQLIGLGIVPGQVDINGDLVASGIVTASTFNSIDDTEILSLNSNKLLAGDGTSNLFLGCESFNDGVQARVANIGSLNIGIGFGSGKFNSTAGGGINGTRNVYIGLNSGFGNTAGVDNTGHENIGLGANTLQKNTTGYSNVAIGESTLLLNTSGIFNTGIGRSSLSTNLTGFSNVAIGDRTGVSNKGSLNTFLGALSGFRNNGSSNMFIGYRSGIWQTAANNVFLIDNQDRGSAAAELIEALVYGTFNNTVASQTLRINATTDIGNNTTAQGLNVFGEVIAGAGAAKIKLTSIGGYAIKLTNETGGNTVAGQTVTPDTAVDDAVVLTIAGDSECVGVFLDSGVADGSETWVVVAGIADVAMEDNTATTRGNWVETSNSEAGYANAEGATPPAAPEHFDEIGHCIESVSATGGGTHILARCVLHFN